MSEKIVPRKIWMASDIKIKRNIKDELLNIMNQFRTQETAYDSWEQPTLEEKIESIIEYMEDL